MTCADSSDHQEKAVSKVAGVESVGVNLMLGSMSVTAEDSVTAQEIIAAVVQAGYGAELGSNAKASVKAQDEETARMKKRLIWSIAFLVPLFYIAMGHMMGLPVPHALVDNALVYGLVQLALCVPILVLNKTYFTVGFSRLFQRSPNMDSLVALGAAAGLVYSLIELFRAGGGMPHFYFESAGMILTLVTVGKFLEQRSKARTTDAISTLLAMAPDSAVVKRDGAEVTVPVADVRGGDTVIQRAGAKGRGDGTVSSGSGALDESAITGESLPAEKEPGQRVTSGTVVRSGYLELTAERVGGDTTLSQIVKLMEEAAGSKAPISRLADKIAAVFVPVVITIALTSAILWATVGGKDIHFCLSTAIAVLVISCPCALGLATPVAIMVGTGKAAEKGILIKSAASLELLGHLDRIVLDKTGTVTAGRMRLTDTVTAPGVERRDLLALAAAVEQLSEHPLARAIVDEAAQHDLPAYDVADFTAIPGGGVSALVEGKAVLGGNGKLMAAHHIDISPLGHAAGELAAKGKTPLFFAVDGALWGILALADTVKPDSADAIAALKALGHKVTLLTGDNERTAQAIAQVAGVDEVIAQVLPQDKAHHIKAYQARGEKVAMVGDGVNDAPALVQADVGLAIGAGTDVAIESADVVLMHSSLQDIVGAVELSRAVLRNIRQNLFWAFFYNTVGIPIAAGVLYPAFGITLNPMIGAACMSLSSVCVVTNALRLRFWHPKYQEISASAEEHKEETSMQRTVSIEGMMCPMCVKHATKALTDLGLTAEVSLENKNAVVTGEATDDAIRAAIAEAGYTVTDIK